MSNKLYEENDIQSIANAIRAKNGSTDTYTIAQMSDAITNISALDTSDANATESDVAKDKTAYVNGVKVTGTAPQNFIVTSTIASVINANIITLLNGVVTNG